MKSVERQFVALESPMGARNGADYYISLCAHSGRPEVPTEWANAELDRLKALGMTEGDHYLTKPDDARDKHADLIAGWLDKPGV